ncbi:hypothetical protein GGR50DRAFT_225454 [Xylaria sp. CBS 124048]|nr:hypothetical protein GGR50DRAFT_225454 [Xylaria sp. CBS 124048]
MPSSLPRSNKWWLDPVHPDAEASSGDEDSEDEDSKNKWKKTNGFKSPIGDKADTHDMSDDTHGIKRRETTSTKLPSSDTGIEADEEQTLSREESKPVRVAEPEPEPGPGPERDLRRRRRRRNQPAWYDADKEKKQDNTQALAERPPQPPPQQLDQQVELLRQQQQLEFQRQQHQFELQQQRIEFQLREQEKKRNNSLKLRLDLNLDVELTLKAKIRGDLTLALLEDDDGRR